MPAEARHELLIRKKQSRKVELRVDVTGYSDDAIGMTRAVLRRRLPGDQFQIEERQPDNRQPHHRPASGS